MKIQKTKPSLKAVQKIPLSGKAVLIVSLRRTALKSKTHPSAHTPTTAHQQGGEAAICCRKCTAAAQR